MSHQFLIFFLFLIFPLISLHPITADYDPNLDIITHNGIIYFPKKPQKFLSPLIFQEEQIPKTSEPKEEEKQVCEEELVTGGTYWFFLFMVTILTLFAGLMSGLTVGYLSVDDLTMELKSTNGTEEEKFYSSRVLPVISNRHWLLCTLLLMNSFAMEALPVFLDRIFSRLTAVVISVTLLLIFGEVIPQALCTGPRQIQIASMMAPFTLLLMKISSPITFFLGKALDIILGEHHKSRFQNTDLKALVEMHTYKALKELQEEEEKHKYIPKDEIAKPGSNMGLNDMEANLMISALEIREKKVIEIMIPFNKVYMLNYDEKINQNKIYEIIKKGFSRIPVYTNNNIKDIIGLLRIKQLIGFDYTKNMSLRETRVHLKLPLVIHPSMTLIDLVREFRKGKSHMAFITENVEKLQVKLGLNRTNSLLVENKFLLPSKGDLGIEILGIITLEDVIENVFNLEILDEDDYEKIKKENLGGRTKSNINMYFTREVAETFINQQSKKIDELIKGSLYKKNEKEDFLNKMENYDYNKSPSPNKSNLKEPLV